MPFDIFRSRSDPRGAGYAFTPRTLSGRTGRLAVLVGPKSSTVSLVNRWPPLRWSGASACLVADARPLGPLRPVDAGRPDPAGVTPAAAPGAMAGAGALDAGMIPDQHGVLAQLVSRRTPRRHGLCQSAVPDPVVLLGQAKVLGVQHSLIRTHVRCCDQMPEAAKTPMRVYSVWINPPSMTKSAPVTFPARPLASSSTRSATSSGVVNRRVAEPATAPSAIAVGSAPVAAANASATPPAPSHSGVLTGPGLMVLTRMPCGPSSFESALEKLVRPALAAV